jgi:hypothetical protein
MSEHAADHLGGARDLAMSKIVGGVAIFVVMVAILSGIIFSSTDKGAAMRVKASFARDAIGASPNGWMPTMTGTGNPKWTVEKDATSPSGGNVVKQSGTATFPLLLKEDTSIRNGFVEIRFKAIAGNEDRAGGIVWRAKDANNYYVLRANALENNVVLYKTVDGRRSALDIVGRKSGYGVKISVPSDQWNTLRVEFEGSRYGAYFNGKLVFEVDDITFLEAGRIGLWTKADSMTLFDDITYGSSP